jgi:small subunit ribosomal protein S16
MVVIRLARRGAKKLPFYNIVVAESHNARDGKFIERVGYFNPVAKGKEVRLHMKKERVSYWTSKGAKPSDRVLRLLQDYEQQGVQQTTPAAVAEVKTVPKEETSQKEEMVQKAEDNVGKQSEAESQADKEH